MRYETKIMKSSSTQTKNIEKNIHSIKDDDTKKVFDNAKHTIGQGKNVNYINVLIK